MATEVLRNSAQISASLLLNLPPLVIQLGSPKQFSQSKYSLQIHSLERTITSLKLSAKNSSIKCEGNPNQQTLRTCKNCKTQFDPSLNHPRACRFHTSHFGGETKRKFESVFSGGTMSTPDSGEVFQYWHCCGSEDPFDPGCTASPHSSYDD